MLLLGRYDGAGRLRYTGRAVPLARTGTASLAEALTPDVGEHPWAGRTFTAGWGSRDVLDVTLVDPQLVEVDVDVARDGQADGATPYASPPDAPGPARLRSDPTARPHQREAVDAVRAALEVPAAGTVPQRGLPRRSSWRPARARPWLPRRARTNARRAACWCHRPSKLGGPERSGTAVRERPFPVDGPARSSFRRGETHVLPRGS